MVSLDAMVERLKAGRFNKLDAVVTGVVLCLECSGARADARATVLTVPTLTLTRQPKLEAHEALVER